MFARTLDHAVSLEVPWSKRPRRWGALFSCRGSNNPTNYADPTEFGPTECLFNASAAVFSAFFVAGTGAAAVATGGLAIVGLIGAIGFEATTAAAAGYYCGELIR